MGGRRADACHLLVARHGASWRRDGRGLRTGHDGDGGGAGWDSERRAIRTGTYKAHFITSGAYDASEPRTVHTPPLLFDLAEDPGERFNVAAAHPDIVADMIREADAHRRTVVPTKPLFDEVLSAAPGRQQ